MTRGICSSTRREYTHRTRCAGLRNRWWTRFKEAKCQANLVGLEFPPPPLHLKTGAVLYGSGTGRDKPIITAVDVSRSHRCGVALESKRFTRECISSFDTILHYSPWNMTVNCVGTEVLSYVSPCLCCCPPPPPPLPHMHTSAVHTRSVRSFRVAHALRYLLKWSDSVCLLLWSVSSTRFSHSSIF